MKTTILSNYELLLIRGGGDPIKPISRPRDVYDDEEEEQAQSANLSGAEEAHKWVEWLKNWLESRK
jgi:hypothetical protein